MKKRLLFLLLAMSLPLFAQSTYQLGTNNTPGTFVCSMASVYPIQSPYEFNCNGVPLLSNGVVVGRVQIMNGGGWAQVHAPGIAEPQQYLQSRLVADESKFVLPQPPQSQTGCQINETTPGNVVFNYQITDANGSVFHGTFTAPWFDKRIAGGRGCVWYAPNLLTTPVDGTLTIYAGPLP